ncbi:MAG: tetratricopeptide repeat protein, partial [Gemmatimonadota bacterium]
YYWSRSDPVAGKRHLDAALRYAEGVTERERLMIQGKAAEWRGDRESAATAYRTLAEQYPNDDIAWGNLAYQQMRLSRTDEAANSYRRVLELDSLDANALINLATVYALEGEHTRANEHYRRAFRVAPGYRTSTGILHEYGLNLVHLGRIEEAERVYREWTEDESAALRAQGLRSTAMIRFLQGRFRDAEELLRRAIVLNRSTNAVTSEVRNRGFLIEARFRRGAPIDDELSEAVRLAVDNYVPSYWVHHIGVWLARAGRTAEAATLVDSARARVDQADRTRAAVMRLEAELALARQDETTAIDRLQASSTVEPDWRLPTAALAELRRRRGELEAAESLLHDVLGSPDHAPGDEGQVEWVLARYRLARIQERLGRVDEARENYERFLAFWAEGDPGLVQVTTARDRLRALAEPRAAPAAAAEPPPRR